MALEKLILFRHKSGRKFYARRITSRTLRVLSKRQVGFVGFLSGIGGETSEETFISSDDLLGPDSEWTYQSGQVYES